MHAGPQRDHFRVLHSMAPPKADTRYATHMAALAGPDVRVRFFSWRAAYFGAYDVFHLHWIEQLIGDEAGLAGRLRWARLRLLLLLFHVRRTPVVHTLHNLGPHDRTPSARFVSAARRFASLTRVEIRLVPEPERRTSAVVAEIPHGHYRTAFAAHERAEAEDDLLLAFGIIKPYKGIGRLLAAFADIPDERLRLRIVGEPAAASVVEEIEGAVSRDERVSRRYGFVSDAELVREVTAAGLVVLPYTEMHSSGAVLVALSLNRPVLVPESPTSTRLAAEVGAPWVHTFRPPLRAEAIEAALAAGRPAGRPDLSARDWDRVRRAHVKAYARACYG